MVFNSIDYFIFLFIVLVLFYLIKGRSRLYLLLAASVMFYMFAKVEYIFIIAGVILVSYFGGIIIEKQKVRKLKNLYFILGITLILFVLLYFKYFNFLNNNLSIFLELFKTSSPIPFYEVILPIGLSFYIFQAVGYLIDVQRETIKAEKDFIVFSVFIMFFPKLLVGPIERSKTFLPQLKKPIIVNTDDFTEGLKLIVWGLFKKLVIADRIAIYTNAVFYNYNEHTGTTLIFSSLIYAIQLYADFSGYTDIALGSARLFSFKLIPNFNRPYMATSIAEFWRRWHMSLSFWFRDYVFLPIAYKTARITSKWEIRSRIKDNINYISAAFVAMLLIGLWHGASWNFIIFGLLQAAGLIFEALTKRQRKRIGRVLPKTLWNGINILFVFIFFSFSLIFFKSPGINYTLEIINKIFTSPYGSIFIDYYLNIIYALLGCLIILTKDVIEEYNLLKPPLLENNNWVFKQLPYVFMVILIFALGVFDGGQFIYFKF